MKTIILILLITISNSLFAQSATLSNDTAKYQNKSFAVGDTLYLGYGSSENKGFSYIQIGSGLGGVQDLQKAWSKSTAVIDKIYINRKKVYLRAKFIDNLAFGNKLFIDLEGAIDNKELSQ